MRPCRRTDGPAGAGGARADGRTALHIGGLGRATRQYLGNVAYIDRLREAVTAMSDLAVDGPDVDMRAGFWQVPPAHLPASEGSVALPRLTATSTCARAPAWGVGAA